VHGDPADPSLLAFVLDGELVLTCKRADLVIVV